MGLSIEQLYKRNGKRIEPIRGTHKTTKTENRREDNKHDQDYEKRKSQKAFQQYLKEKAQEGNKQPNHKQAVRKDTVTISKEGRNYIADGHGAR